MPTVTEAVEFLAWLLSSSNRAPATVNTHYSALADPLCFGLGVVVPQRELTLQFRGIRTARPPHHPPLVDWSLQKVMHYLSFEGVDVDVTRSLHRVVFLLVLASEYRSSQLTALTKYPAYTFVAENWSSATITLLPAFRAKNEQADSLIDPLRIPALLEGSRQYPLCPVCELKHFTQTSFGCGPSFIRADTFHHPSSHNRLQLCCFHLG